MVNYKLGIRNYELGVTNYDWYDLVNLDICVQKYKKFFNYELRIMN